MDFLTFKICYQAGAQSFKHYLIFLYKITSMNKIEIKIYKFPQEDNVSMFDIGLFYSMCLICDSYLLKIKYFLVLINISRNAIKQNCAQSNFRYLLTFVC